MICPTCRKPFVTETSNVLPFCSPRCKQIDLGRWLDEKFSLPIERDDEAEDPMASYPDSDDDR
jgi:endogenous inhibitor of DNA gyrase (YacG/DUF329 family)